ALPPVTVRARFGAHPLVSGVRPARGDGDLGPLVVRPDHASGGGKEHRNEEEVEARGSVAHPAARRSHTVPDGADSGSAPARSDRPIHPTARRGPAPVSWPLLELSIRGRSTGRRASAG